MKRQSYADYDSADYLKSENGNPSFATILKVTRALGFRLSPVPV